LFIAESITRLCANGSFSKSITFCSLPQRAIIETVNDQLKNIAQIEHSRHRSLWNFLGNVAAGLIAYSFREKKPSLNLDKTLQLQSIAF
jgi:hypothetical protein